MFTTDNIGQERIAVFGAAGLCMIEKAGKNKAAGTFDPGGYDISKNRSAYY